MPTTVPTLYPRHAAPRLSEALADSPVVLLHGPRQCGKTTLARTVGQQLGYGYSSFDDNTVREAASADPEGFVADLPDHVVLDEVQRVPTLFLALKRTVDERRAPGRFLLTGSSHVLTVPKLAGRRRANWHRDYIDALMARLAWASATDCTPYLYGSFGRLERGTAKDSHWTRQHLPIGGNFAQPRRPCSRAARRRSEPTAHASIR